MMDIKGTIEQITDADRKAELHRNEFKDILPPGIPIYMHKIIVGDKHVGYVATEDHGLAAGPHIYVFEEYRTRPVLADITWTFKNVYCPLLKKHGKIVLVTNCDRDDQGTRNFMDILGFSLKEVVIAEYVL